MVLEQGLDTSDRSDLINALNDDCPVDISPLDCASTTLEAGLSTGRLPAQLVTLSARMDAMGAGHSFDASLLSCKAYAEARKVARQGWDQGVSTRDPTLRCWLLTQKSLAEGALALCVFAARVFGEKQQREISGPQQRADLLFEILFPVLQYWPMRYGSESFLLAAQGRRPEVPETAGVQQDDGELFNRLSLSAAHTLGEELLCYQIPKHQQYGYQVFKQEVRITLQLAELLPSIAPLAERVSQALDHLDQVTACLSASANKGLSLAFANTGIYIDLFARVAMAWVWLQQAVLADKSLSACDDNGPDDKRRFYQGKLQAARFFIEWELPQALLQAKRLELRL